MAAHKRIVVIGTSAGGVEALKTIGAALPRDFPAPICVVVHTAPESPGVLDAILNRAGPLPATTVQSGERLEPGHIYVPPPDHHLLVEPGVLKVTKGPKENRFRPAIDPLFRSAAQVYGPDAIGIVLTGSLDDGTAGLWTIKQLGGIAIVQDPDDALFPSMPESALRYVSADYVVPLSDIVPTLMQVVASPVEARERVPVPAQVELEIDIAKERNAVESGIQRFAEPTTFTCPECHGVLLQLKETSPLRFRCHTGHAFTLHSLVAALSAEIENTLWGAVRSLQEGSLLLEHLSDHLKKHEHTAHAGMLVAQAREALEQANAIREIVMARHEFTVPGP